MIASEAKITVLWNNFVWWVPPRSEEKFQKTLILAFEVMLQQLKGLPQRLKSMFFEKKIHEKMILAFETNRPLSCQNGLFSVFSSLCSTTMCIGLKMEKFFVRVVLDAQFIFKTSSRSLSVLLTNIMFLIQMDCWFHWEENHKNFYIHFLLWQHFWCRLHFSNNLENIIQCIFFSN